MAANKERDELKRAYPSKQWAEKVDKMSAEQVIAVYMRLRAQGKIRI
jgi:hypothetical protein